MSESDVNIRNVIYDQIKTVAAQNRKILAPLTDKVMLLESRSRPLVCRDLGRQSGR